MRPAHTYRRRAEVVPVAVARARAARRKPTGRTATELELMDSYVRSTQREMEALGITMQDIAKGGFGWVQVIGKGNQTAFEMTEAQKKFLALVAEDKYIGLTRLR